MSGDSDSVDVYKLDKSSNKDDEENDDMYEFCLYDEIEVKETINNQILAKCEDTYDIDKHIFNPTKIAKLKYY